MKKLKPISTIRPLGYSLCIFFNGKLLFIYLQVDNVKDPSWQAQITGTKKWTLEPPSECYFECKSRFEVTVEPGEISKSLGVIMDNLTVRNT